MARAASPSGWDRSAAARWSLPITATSAARARSSAAASTSRARWVNREKSPKPASILTGPRGTNRCCAACLLTPMLAPIWLQDAPERRAWSTKWPISESAWSLSWADTVTASERLSSGEPPGAAP